MERWITLGEYLNKEMLINTEAILNGNKISFQVITPETHLNSALGQATSQPFIIQVLEEQFEEAKCLVHGEDANVSIVEVPMKDYTIEELKEIVLNPEDWHNEFVNRAREELKTQGEHVSETEIEDKRNKKIEALKKGTDPSLTIYYFMWFFAILGVT